MTDPLFAAKVIMAAVVAKALLMGILVSQVVAEANFAQSLILVVVSATATGIFGVVIVLVQAHSEREMHARIDQLEGKADKVVETTQATAEAVDALPTDRPPKG